MPFDFQNDLTFSDGGAASVTDAAFSPDGKYLAMAASVATAASASNIPLYKRNGSVFERLGAPDVLPSSYVRGACFSPDGNYLALAWQGVNGLYVYKRNGDAFNKVAQGATVQSALSVDWSPDGSKIAVGTGNASNVIMCIFAWDQATETLTKATVNQMTLGSTPSGRNVRWAANSLYCYLHDTGNKATYLTQYNPGSGTWAVGTYKTVAGASTWMSLDKTGTYMAMTLSVAPYLAVWKFDPNNGQLWDLAVPTLHTGARRCVRFVTGTGDVPHMIVTGDNIPRAEIFAIVADVVTAVDYTFPSIPALPIVGEQVSPRELNLVFATASGTVLYTDEAKISKVTFPTFQAAGELGFAGAPPVDGDGVLQFPAFSVSALVGLSEPEVFTGPTFVIAPGSVEVDGGDAAFSVSFSDTADSVIVPPFQIKSASIEVDGEAPTISEVASQPFTYGHPRFPAFSLAGEVEVHDDAEIRIGFPIFTASGLAGIAVSGNGVARFGLFSASGEVQIPGGEFLAAQLPFPAFLAAGAGTVPFGARGDLMAFPGLAAAGLLSQPIQGDATLAFPSLSAAGLGGPAVQVNGVIRLASFGVAGLGAPDAQIQASAVFPAFGLAGDFVLVPPIEVSAALAFPRMVAAGEVVLPIIAGAVTFPSFGTDGYVKIPILGNAVLGFAPFRVDALVARPLHVDIQARFPAFKVRGAAGSPIRVSGALRFPSFKARIRIKGLPAKGVAGVVFSLSAASSFQINPQIKFGRTHNFGE